MDTMQYSQMFTNKIIEKAQTHKIYTHFLLFIIESLKTANEINDYE